MITRLPFPFDDVILWKPQVFRDPRGFFLESFNLRSLENFGLYPNFVQDNHSRSTRGILRGLHYQLHYPQAKLCRVVSGEVWDVVVDIRHNSPTFGHSAGTLLSAQNFHQIFVPRGFAHGFLVLSEVAEFLYKCDEYYHPEDEMGIAWNDPDLGIDWKLSELSPLEPQLSIKDNQLRRLRDIPTTQLSNL